MKSCLLEHTNNFLAKHPLGCIAACGDFNLSDVCWVSYHGASNYYNDIVDSFAHFNGIQLVESPTHVSQNIIDLFICNKPQFCSLDVLSEKFSSDHYPITMCKSLQHDRMMTAGSDIEYFSKSNFNPDIFNENMYSDESLLSTYYFMNSVDFYNNWYSLLPSAVQASTQRKRKKRKNLPFHFSSQSLHISNQIETEKRRLGQIGDEASMKLLTLQEDISQPIALDKILFVSLFNTLSTNDSFKQFKQLSGVSPIPPEVFLGNAKASDDKAKAELFNEFLSSVYQEECFKFTPASSDGNCDFYLDKLSLSTNYIEELLLKISKSSSPTDDIIPPFILKTCASNIDFLPLFCLTK